MPKPTGDTNLFRMSLLLLVAERPDHGYRIAERVKELGLLHSSSSVYGELRRLERLGLLRSKWEVQKSGPACRVYAITPAGHKLLQTWEVPLARMSRLHRRYRIRRRTRTHGG